MPQRRGWCAYDILGQAAAVTDANAALFDARNAFAGCIPGLHEILRRQGLMAGRWCLDPNEDLSPGQLEEIDRVVRAYPQLQDDDSWRRISASGSAKDARSRCGCSGTRLTIART